jgi:hypothetical protein
MMGQGLDSDSNIKKLIRDDGIIINNYVNIGYGPDTEDLGIY